MLQSVKMMHFRTAVNGSSAPTIAVVSAVTPTATPPSPHWLLEHVLSYRSNQIQETVGSLNWATGSGQGCQIEIECRNRDGLYSDRQIHCYTDVFLIVISGFTL